MRLLVAIAVVLAAALLVVASLQYRWIGDISAAEEQRAVALRDMAAHHFAGDVDRDIGQIVGAFQATQADELAARYREWSAIAPDKRLIDVIYVADPNRIQRFDGEKLVDAEWPPQFEIIRKEMQLRPPPRRRTPLLADIPAIVLPMRPGPPPGPRFEDDGFRPPPPDEFGFGGPPQMMRPPRREAPPATVLIQLSRDYLTHTLFPDLKRRYLGDEYDVAIVNGNEFIYRSDPKSARADLSLPIMRVGPPDTPGWRLFVHRRGAALNEVVAESRRRNLIISSAVLALLAGSFVLLAVLARRAERQRLQQLEFVAGITHEVNTPLAALTSAGQNLADGVVSDPKSVKTYGTMVVKESRRLADLVAQVLDFAGLQSRGAPLRRERVDVASLIDEAIAQSAWIAEERHVEIEQHVARNLPNVTADAPSLTRAIQNLIANAIRHGGDGGWVGVRAVGENGHVSIVVEDRGRGVAARDVPHLFEPFYRSKDSTNVRGTGLGLTIVQQIARAHGGAVTIDSRRAHGAAFTLRIPAEPASV